MRIINKCFYDINTNLKDIEFLFKKFYLKNKSRCLDKPHNIEESYDIFHSVSQTLNNFMPELLLDSLMEDSFFNEKLDVSIYPHLRYFPCVYHKHNFFEVTCLIKGNAINYIGNQKIEMKTGDYCIIAPNTNHAISLFSDDSFMINILLRRSTFEKTFLNTFSENDILSDFFIRNLYHSKEISYLLFKTGNDYEVHDFILTLYKEINSNKPYKKRMVNSILTSFFITLLRNHEKDVIIPSNNGIAKKDILPILRYIEDNYKSLSLNDLSHTFNYSERQLQRIIKTYTGISFSKNIQKLKMNYAANLLSKKEISITDISQELGYSNLSNFRQTFKKYYGTTPIEFRNLKQ